MLTVSIECGACAGSGQWPVVRSQGSGVRDQGSGVRSQESEQTGRPLLTPDSCLLTPDSCLLTPGSAATDSYAIKPCPFCEGEASWNLTLTGRLERELRWLVVQQQQARQRPA